MAWCALEVRIQQSFGRLKNPIFLCSSRSNQELWLLLGKGKKAQKLSHSCFDQFCYLPQTVSKTNSNTFCLRWQHPQITSSEQKSMERTEPPQHFTTPPWKAHLRAHSSLQLVVWLVLSKTKCEHSISCLQRRASWRQALLFLDMTSVTDRCCFSDSTRTQAVSVPACLCSSCTLWLKAIKPGRKMLIIAGLFVILFPKASKGNRKIGISGPLNAQLSTKSHHQIFKSINTVGGHCALLEVSLV